MNTQNISNQNHTNQETVIRKSNTPPSIVNNKVLFRTKTSDFLGFQTDELLIQEKSVSVIHRSFLSCDVETIQISDMTEVLYSSNTWHSTLTLIGKNPQEELCIEDLPGKEAEQAKSLLEQLLVRE